MSFLINKFIIIVIILIQLVVIMLSEIICENKFTENNFNDDIDELPKYKEYYKDHEISYTDAKQVFDLMKNDLLTANLPAYCKSCSTEDKKYCLSSKLLHDHCCCAHRHRKDEFPWLPHSCYVGLRNGEPHIGSCISFIDIKDCCCNRLLAEEWKTKYSDATKKTSSLFLWPYPFMPLLIFIYCNFIFL